MSEREFPSADDIVTVRLHQGSPFESNNPHWKYTRVRQVTPYGLLLVVREKGEQETDSRGQRLAEPRHYIAESVHFCPWVNIREVSPADRLPDW